MIESLTPLVSALRNELTHYGEMLSLLEQQQESAIHRVTDDLVRSTGLIQSAGEAAQIARRDRESLQRTAARELGLIENSTFAEIIPQLPADYRPLVESLVEENNALLHRIQQRARQNHLLLSRTVELMQRFISMLFPTRDVQVYNDRGTKLAPAFPTGPLYEAVG